MSERFFNVGPGCDLDGNFRLYLRGARLEPCARIEQPDITVGIVDNRTLNPRRLMLVEKDQKPLIVTIPDTQEVQLLPHPGKSAFLVLDEKITKERVHRMVREAMDGEPDRRDHLHTASVRCIEEAGWQVWWAPLPMTGRVTHVRLVANATLWEDGVSLEDAELLAAAFMRVY